MVLSKGSGLQIILFGASDTASDKRRQKRDGWL